jgi:hypothetical protein
VRKRLEFIGLTFFWHSDELFLNEEGVYHDLLHNKYIENKNLLRLKQKPTYSSFWKVLVGVKEDLFSTWSFVIRDIVKTRFWEDT